MDPADPIEECITVFVRQDDLAAACTVDCADEPCDAASYLPNEPPIEEDTGAAFEPFDVPDRETTVTTLPETPVELFQRSLCVVCGGCPKEPCAALGEISGNARRHDRQTRMGC
jgi:hypothetical protein